MKTAKVTALFALLSLLTLGPLQAEKPRISPHETVAATIDGAAIKIVYGRPYTKDPKSGAARKIWGGLVPFGQVWRMGADEATMLTTDHDLDLGGTKIPAGSYTLFMQPAEDGTAKLIVNKQTGQWGTKHDTSQDFAKIDLKKSSLSTPVDQFTISLEKAASAGGTLSLKWENAEYTAPITAQK